MFFLRSESESSAGFQPAVSQVFNLQGIRTGDLIASNRAFWSVESSEISRPASGLQDEILRYSRTGVLRYVFGPTSTIEPLEPPGNPSNHVAREELKPFWMQFKKDEANPRNPN